MMSIQTETVIGGIIETAKKRSMFLTGIAAGLAVLFGATSATTVSVPAMIADITRLNWIMLLAFGPVTAIIIAYLGAALIWGVIVSATVWGISKVEYFSKLPDGLSPRDLSAIEADALETRLRQAMKKAGEWITCRISDNYLIFKVNIFTCSFVVLVVILISTYIRSRG
jgi:hypothetical protein